MDHNSANRLQRHIISINSTLREALRMINELSGSDAMTLFAVDDELTMIGTVTDGDIRRALLRGAMVEDAVSIAVHRNFLAAGDRNSRYKTVAEARRRQIDLLPVIEDNRLTGLIDLHRQHSQLPVDAVLMAGGRGERLRPMTLSTPKPLLKIGRKPIIDHNIDELLANGITNIFVTVNYLHEQIEEHFSDNRFEGMVKCVLEPKRLGTIGSLALIDDFEHENVLLMNSDLLTTMSFEKFFIAHTESGAALTIATIPYTVSVPFAIVNTEGDSVTSLSEKPTYNYFANAGVYLMKREVIRRIPKGEYLDAPDFIASLIASGEKVSSFPIEGLWTDIGSPDDFRYANELMSSIERSKK